MKSEKKKAADRVWYARNAERIKTNLREQYATDPAFREKKKQVSDKHYKKHTERHKEQARKSSLKTKYGITPDQFEEMNAAQEGLCKICKQHPQASDPRKTRLCVDHCHTTGRVRGLLCHDCNVLLGFSNDSPAILYRAIEYLNSYAHS